MSDFEPGEGWREVPAGELTGDRRRIVEYGPDGETRRKWVREVPVPPLPTEPYTVIRVTWRHGRHTFLILTPVGWQDIDGTPIAPGATEKFLREITGFEVLAEPRAVTARAVLDRVRKLDAFDHISRDFGVKS